MLTVEDAKKRLFENTGILGKEKRNVSDTIGYILAEDVKARFDIPQFDQSAVDGFAISLNGQSPNDELSLPFFTEVKAGDKPISSLKKNTAVRIYTGAPVPTNVTGIVMQEKTIVKENLVVVPSGSFIPGSNIRLKGTQIRKGEIASGYK